MRRIAITGHRGLPAEVEQAVGESLRTRISEFGEALVGLSCLADGADTLFARAVLESGARLEVIVPAGNYRVNLPASHRTTYDALLAGAVVVHRLPYAESTPQSHLEAGRHMVERCDELIAVWDGEPPRGPGGTAEIVEYARWRRRPVTVVWPEGARR